MLENAPRRGSSGGVVGFITEACLRAQRRILATNFKFPARQLTDLTASFGFWLVTSGAVARFLRLKRQTARSAFGQRSLAELSANCAKLLFAVFAVISVKIQRM